MDRGVERMERLRYGGIGVSKLPTNWNIIVQMW